MRMIELIKLPDFFTLGNVLCGLISILLVTNGKLFFAAMLLLLAAAFDNLDGRVARLTKRESAFGKELDSLADIVSFGVAPVVFAFSFEKSILSILAYMVFLSAGMLRLARFNVTDNKGFYEGMPIPLAALLIAVLFFLRMQAVFYPITLSLFAILMMGSFRVKKSLNAQIILLLIALIAFIHYLIVHFK